MAYVTQQDFTSVYIGSVTIPTADFPALAERASDLIDDLTRRQIAEAGLQTYETATQTLIKKAVCAQIEHLYLQGIENAVSGGADGSYSIGSTSLMQYGSSGKAATGASARYSPLAKSFLAGTGLLYRGVDVC